MCCIFRIEFGMTFFFILPFSEKMPRGFIHRITLFTDFVCSVKSIVRKVFFIKIANSTQSNFSFEMS